MKYRISRLDMLVVAAVILGGVCGAALLYWLLSASSIVITNNQDVPARTTSALSGQPCDNARRRPVAVMLSSDTEARPLSGVGQADMVFEMPVTPNGITRMMAVYQCTEPRVLGSIRSARGDFVPLAQGLDAILVHWGGERDTLAALNNGVIDNIDALKYEGTTFYRTTSAPRPHNGFTTSELIQTRADALNYRATTSLDPYAHRDSRADRNIGSLADDIHVAWPQDMDVTFTYDNTTNTYLRSRGGTPEIDTSTDRQVSVSVVVLMQTEASFLYDQYIHVKTIGSGVATIWQGGRRINALWKKDRATDMLRFTDSRGQEIALEPGSIWVLIDAPLPAI